MSNEEILKYAEELINKNQYAIVGTISKSFPNIRALKVMKKEGLKTLYFSTKKTSEKVNQMKRNKKGCLFFYDTTNYSSVMLEGTFEIKDNVLFDVSTFFDLHPEPYDFCNIIFNTTKVYVYLQYKGYEIKI
jgi:general stress protein 26